MLLHSSTTISVNYSLHLPDTLHYLYFYFITDSAKINDEINMVVTLLSCSTVAALQFFSVIMNIM